MYIILGKGKFSSEGWGLNWEGMSFCSLEVFKQKQGFCLIEKLDLEFRDRTQGLGPQCQTIHSRSARGGRGGAGNRSFTQLILNWLSLLRPSPLLG